MALKATLKKGRMVVKSFKHSGPTVSKVTIHEKDRKVRKEFTRRVRDFY